MKPKRLRNLPNNDKCWYCGEAAQDVDHQLPVSKGGTSSRTNLVPACRLCNNCKGDKTVDEFRDFLKAKDLIHSTKYTLLKVKPYGFMFYGERS